MADLPDMARTEIVIVELTNAFRRSERLAEVRSNAELTRAAKLFADYLARTGRFAHEADGRGPAERVEAAGYRYCMVSENLASNLDSRGFTADKLAKEAVDGWKDSPGHRKNMVEPHVTDIGVGVARAPTADPKFISVQIFGRPESLQYEFRVENRTGVTVTYSAANETHTIDPREVTTHSACTPEEVMFERAGPAASGIRLESRFTARDGMLFSIVTGSDGRVRVEAKPGSPPVRSKR